MKSEGKNNLFDIIGALFTDLEIETNCPPEDPSGNMQKRITVINGKDYIKSLTKETIKQNIFMVNRRLAIKYPLQAQCFNTPKTNPVDVLNFWSDYLYTGGRAPSWIYTKGAVKSKQAKNKSSYTNKDLQEYANSKSMSSRDIEFLKKMFPEELEAEILDHKKFIEQIHSN